MFKSITGQNPPRRAAQSELWAKRLQEMEAGGGLSEEFWRVQEPTLQTIWALQRPQF